MNSYEIFKFLKSDEHCQKSFLGVFARDELPIIQKLPVCFIINTDNRNESGEHWLAFYFDERRNAEFFDPIGLHPNFYGLEEYLAFYSNKWKWNKQRIQSFFSNFCGQICLFFLYFRCRNFSLDYILNNFTTNFEKNEKLILNFLKIYS